MLGGRRYYANAGSATVRCRLRKGSEWVGMAGFDWFAVSGLYRRDLTGWAGCRKYRGGDSNPRPADYETAALTN